MNAATPLHLAEVIEAGWSDLLADPRRPLTRAQRRALNAILVCRTPECGSLLMRCEGCGQQQGLARACGHRSCPRCQHHLTQDWLARQTAKLLPVDYFMVTFTLPAGLRGVASRHPALVYAALFQAAAATLKRFGQQHKLQIELGLCAVLHTHARNLDYHPHVHVVVPGGGIHRARRQWCRLKGHYLFNGRALARMFRGKLLAALAQAGLSLPTGLPSRWIVDCRKVGRGLPALRYLSRYLYRGVISERNLVALDRQQRTLTFRYQPSGNRPPVTRTLSLADFLWRLVQHVLPDGFRRVRDYGFLHHNAKKIRHLVQLLLRVRLLEPPAPQRSAWCCPCCQQPMHCVGILLRRFATS